MRTQFGPQNVKRPLGRRHRCENL